MFNSELINRDCAIRIVNFHDHSPRQLTPDTVEALLESNSILEKITIQDLEKSSFGSYSSDESEALLEAISTTRNRIAQTMRAFIRALNQKMGGAGITAGDDTAGSADDGTKTLGGASIGRVRRVAGFAIMPAMISLSDGQVVTVMFHSPSGDQDKILPGDVLVAFQFLLNKKDVTHVVAPMGGRDMSLAQVTMTLSNIIERNTQKFQRNQKRQQRMKADLAEAQKQFDAENEQELALQSSLGEEQGQATNLEISLNSLQVDIEHQQDYNAELRTRIAEMSEQIKTRSGGKGGGEDGDNSSAEAPAATVQLSDIQTGAMWPTLKKASVSGANAIWYTQSNEFDIKASAKISLNGVGPGEGAKKLYAQYQAARDAGYSFTYFRISGLQGIYVFVKDNEVLTKAGAMALVKPDGDAGASDVVTPPPAADTDTANARKFRYALRNRPAGIGAVPPGQAGLLPRPPESDPYYEYARHGIITYDTALNDEQISQFELLYLPRADEYPELAKNFAADALGTYAQQYIEMAAEDPDTFEKTVRIKFRNSLPNVAYPLGEMKATFLADVVSALQAMVQPPEEENPPGGESEADKMANQAIEYLKSVVVMASSDMQEIRAARGHVREAIATLQAAGRFDENEDLVNQAAQRLSDLLVEIQRAGATGVAA